MTDRAKALIVVLEENWRLGDGATGADHLIEAIRCLQGVVEVTPMVADADHYIAVSVARSDLQHKIYEALHEIWEATR